MDIKLKKYFWTDAEGNPLTDHKAINKGHAKSVSKGKGKFWVVGYDPEKIEPDGTGKLFAVTGNGPRSEEFADLIASIPALQAENERLIGIVEEARNLAGAIIYEPKMQPKSQMVKLGQEIFDLLHDYLCPDDIALKEKEGK